MYLCGILLRSRVLPACKPVQNARTRVGISCGKLARRKTGSKVRRQEKGGGSTRSSAGPLAGAPRPAQIGSGRRRNYGEHDGRYGQRARKRACRRHPPQALCGNGNVKSFFGTQLPSQRRLRARPHPSGGLPVQVLKVSLQHSARPWRASPRACRMTALHRLAVKCVARLARARHNCCFRFCHLAAILALV